MQPTAQLCAVLRVCVFVPGATTVYMTQSIMPHHANTLDITFGGQVGGVLWWGGQAGGSAQEGRLQCYRPSFGFRFRL
jgi:hypothetical protein